MSDSEFGSENISNVMKDQGSFEKGYSNLHDKNDSRLVGSTPTTDAEARLLKAGGFSKGLLISGILFEARKGKPFGPIDLVGAIIAMSGVVAILSDGLNHNTFGSLTGTGFLAAWLGLAVVVRGGSAILLLGGSFLIACLSLVFAFNTGRLLSSLFH